jgi:glutamyl-tRNA synthetase
VSDSDSKAGSKAARTRFAPSPTGSPHIGNIRTAIFDYFWAKRTGGQFILRIEDTDQSRLKEGALDDIKESLRWLGLDWDEGIEVGGPYAPYTQSERLPIYRQHAEQLVESGKAYYCYCTPERLAAVNAAKKAQNLAPGYDRRCRNISEAEKQEALAQGVKPVVRFKIPLDGKTTVKDEIVKDTVVENATLQDAVLLKSDGFPTYHLAAMVDDHLMDITHVIRGQEWLPSAPLHVMLYEAFGWEPPKFLHVPVILNPPGQKGKLSKRDNAVSVQQYRELGYLPEALLNFLILLGWSYDDKTEMFSHADLLEKFDISGIQPTPARFNLDKLDWFNQQYINHVLTAEDFARRSLPFLAQAGLIEADEAANPSAERMKFFTAVCALVKDKVKTLEDVPDEVSCLFKPAEKFDYPASDLIGKNKGADVVDTILRETITFVNDAPAEIYASKDALLDGLTEVSNRLGLANRGLMFWPSRVAISGRTRSPDLMGMMIVLGKAETVKRLELARQKLSAGNKG